MKEGIHPEYGEVVFRDKAADVSFLTRSTIVSTLPADQPTIEWEDGNSYPVVDLQVSNASHPFWTGKNRTLDTEGAVEKFNRRYGRRTKANA